MAGASLFSAISGDFGGELDAEDQSTPARSPFERTSSITKSLSRTASFIGDSLVKATLESANSLKRSGSIASLSAAEIAHDAVAKMKEMQEQVRFTNICD